MAPDLNSLAAAASPRRSSAVTTPHPTSPSARSPSFSLAAAASINAGIQSNSRRSSLSLSREASQTSTPSLGATRQQNSMRINLNDPGLPGPGELVASEQRRSGSTPEHASPVAIPRASPRFQLGTPAVIGTADPHHHRTPSLGELHQELEQEQEAHVVRILLCLRTPFYIRQHRLIELQNRLLTMIRQQQNQLQQLQSASPTQASQSAIDTEVTTPQSERNVIFTSLPPQQPSSARTHSPNTPRRPLASRHVRVLTAVDTAVETTVLTCDRCPDCSLDLCQDTTKEAETKALSTKRRHRP
jgi:hypothetical protein